MDVGKRLKSIRLIRNMSQRELAKRAGVTNSTISMIEKNSVSPSISSLKKVLNGIPISLVEFFTEDNDGEEIQQVVYTSDELMDIGSGDVHMHLVGKSFPKRQMTFLVETYPENADTGTEMLQNDAEEGGYILEGKIELTVGTDVFILNANDSYYFDNNKPHRFRNPFSEVCKIISATTPANF
ncbi:cupin domain-containing protein [Cognaticolwellia beringensis]|uniref:XRE family transcriptional regulator n=1 Tax=Cognaticolwellia beringensis TaxID=1967665 RepID=A0A222GA59_9GAMM|nr:cupin domain-containing protein [Cognaticolwellia beringensis]ASP48776.1 XRE family transcriptional regulator [Cognaticolwellia beringensis]